jgi:hypothetical protein
MAKVGLSFSRCIRDIVEGKVEIDDILVVIARTNFDPHDDKQWEEIWYGYGGGTVASGSIWSRSEWSGYAPEDEDKFRSVAIELWESGKFHQPRKFGAHPQRLPYYWLETVLASEELEDNPSAKQAWENFQVVAGLTGVKLNKDHK